MDKTCLDSNKLLNILDIIPRLLGKIIVSLCVSGRFVPAGHLMVHNLCAFEEAEICRE